MKKIALSLIAVSALSLAACGSNRTAATNNSVMANDALTVDAANEDVNAAQAAGNALDDVANGASSVVNSTANGVSAASDATNNAIQNAVR